MYTIAVAEKDDSSVYFIKYYRYLVKILIKTNVGKLFFPTNKLIIFTFASGHSKEGILYLHIRLGKHFLVFIGGLATCQFEKC